MRFVVSESSDMGCVDPNSLGLRFSDYQTTTPSHWSTSKETAILLSGLSVLFLQFCLKSIISEVSSNPALYLL